ncbi:MAG TPA: RNase adapter RapZ, partial [Alphaproteobacteria bacterium]|nr:RNase adapter RapZ [Alphaproteobacteria bacterium]
LVFDIRFLANPHYRPELQALSGRDGAVAAFIARDAAFQPFFEGLTTMLRTLLPRFESEGKSYLTIAVGCTGGRHRSVFVAERLAEWLGGLGRRVNLIHRDIERGGSDASPPAGAR